MRSIEVDVMLRLGILIFKTNIKKVECCLAEALRGISKRSNMKSLLYYRGLNNYFLKRFLAEPRNDNHHSNRNSLNRQSLVKHDKALTVCPKANC